MHPARQNTDSIFPADGQAIKRPDSLIKIFRTAKNRKQIYGTHTNLFADIFFTKLPAGNTAFSAFAGATFQFKYCFPADNRFDFRLSARCFSRY